MDKNIIKDNFRQNLDTLVRQKGISRRQFARDLNLPASTVGHWFVGRTYPRTEQLKTLCDYFNVTLDELHGDTKKDEDYIVNIPHVGLNPVATVKVPIYGVISAGEPIFADENIDGYVDVAVTIANKDTFALKIKGDSMDRKLHDGSTAIFHKTPSLDSGQIGAFLINNEYATVKKYKVKNDGSVWLEPLSHSDKHKPILITSTMEFSILGRLVSAIQEF